MSAKCLAMTVLTEDSWLCLFPTHWTKATIFLESLNLFNVSFIPCGKCIMAGNNCSDSINKHRNWYRYTRNLFQIVLDVENVTLTQAAQKKQLKLQFPSMLPHESTLAFQKFLLRTKQCYFLQYLFRKQSGK
jgi:hypothetical protein